MNRPAESGVIDADTGRANHAVTINDYLLASWPLPQPSADGDKEEKGRILLIGGSPEMPGAIILAATAALRAGAGKLAVATAASVAHLVAAKMPEAKVIALPEDDRGQLAPGALVARLSDGAEGYDAVVIGPGFETTPALLDDIAALVPKFVNAQVVLDACAMEIMNRPAWKVLAADARPPVLLTPHAGEMAHLTGLSKDDVKAGPDALLARVTREWQAVVALKGAHTRIGHPDGRCWHHRGGNSGLGVSGSGDTLAGIIGGLAARGASLEQACIWGVALHSRAGDALAGRVGPIGFLARELSGEIPRLMHLLSHM